MLSHKIKTILKKHFIKTRFLRKLCVAYCAQNLLLPEILVRTPPADARGLLFLPDSHYLSQQNQDIFALLVNRFKSAFFVEIGANDGFTLSNTLCLEEYFGWNGLLIEANPKYQDSLNKRRAKSVVAAVAKEEGYYQFNNAGLYGGMLSSLDNTHKEITSNGEIVEVWGTTLKNILESNSVPRIINFISIDVEGAEVAIVEQMCQLKNYRFTCGCIEHNWRKDDYLIMKQMLQAAGYSIVWEDQTLYDLFFVESSLRES